jgi:hypothetical protein
MNGKSNRFVQLLNREIHVLLAISFGVFLFILFFQPFPLEKFDFNNNLLFIAGFAGIVFISAFLIRVTLPYIIRKNDREDEITILNPYLEGFIILVLCSVAFAFYIRYVGSVHISFYIIFKVVLICFAIPVSLKMYDANKGLIRQNESLVAERKSIQKQIEKYEEENLNKSIEFISESGTGNITLPVSEVVLIQSADNYVALVHVEGEKIKKTLIRNTLKNIEHQLRSYSNFIRCHRTSIVNMHYIEKLNRNYGTYSLSMKGYNDKIPVSRQYLLKLKETL